MMQRGRNDGVGLVMRPVGQFFCPAIPQEYGATGLSLGSGMVTGRTKTWNKKPHQAALIETGKRKSKPKAELLKASPQAFKANPKQVVTESIIEEDVLKTIPSLVSLIEQIEEVLPVKTSADEVPGVSSGEELVSQKPHRSASTIITEGGGSSEAIFQQALPRYELNPLPEYPEAAKRRGQQGTVFLEVLVLVDGRVGESRLIESSGYKSLDRAAQKAVRHWQFKPAISLAGPVVSQVIVPVDFILNR